MKPYELSELEFHPVPHQYFVRGREIPSVTTLMKRYGLGFCGYAPQEALQRGQFAHEASVLIDEGDLDWDGVPERWRGYCLAYAAARRAQPGVKIVAAEARFYSPPYWYAGTLDRVVLVPSGPKMKIREIKTGDHSDVDVQCAAYVHARHHWYPHELIDLERGECLKLNEDGSYRLFDLDLVDGWRGFSACLILEERQRRKGRKEAA